MFCMLQLDVIYLQESMASVEAWPAWRRLARERKKEGQQVVQVLHMGKKKNNKPGPTTAWAASFGQIGPKFGPTRWAKMGLVSKEWA